jgi:hypothetical protein
MAFSDSLPEMNQPFPDHVFVRESETHVTPALGMTPPHVLAQEAASGRRGAAWRLLVWIMDNDPRAMEAVSSLQDPRLAQNLLEFIALGSWAGQPFVMPTLLRTPYARTRLRTLFALPTGIPLTCSEPVLLDAVRGSNVPLKEAAMYILGIMGSRAAVPDLLAALHDPLPSTRLQAAKALGRSGSPEAVPALLAALHRADEEQSSQIFMALVNLGHVAVPALLESSKSHSSWMRWHCMRALCAIRDRRAMPALVQALGDTDHSVAWMAAKGLAPFGKDCVEPVLQMLTTAQMTPWLVETSSYVLQQQMLHFPDLKPVLEPVIQQLHQPAFRAVGGLAALKALEQLEAQALLK